MKFHNLSYKCFVVEFDQTNSDEEIKHIMNSLEQAFPSHHFLSMQINDPLLEMTLKEK